ncbi:MAG TPA: TonB-dependent receptor [Candidatus Eremiobacteraceae bacterium]|nr:TonB-dependent receptor [Candidatus Eremiobacteraceae bacterium]
MQPSKAPVIIGLLTCLSLFVAGFGSASAAAPGTVSGKIIDAATGLALSGVLVQTEGPTITASTSDKQGDFQLTGLMPGYYNLLMYLNGYVTTESEPFHVDVGLPKAPLTLSLQRGSGLSQSTRVLGVTTIHASATLQKASLIYKAVSAEPLQQQGFYRVSDYLQQLPGVVGSNVAQPGDDTSLNIRGIGSFETLAMIDGHPMGPRSNFNFELSPVFGLRAVDVFYGSGGSDLYGIDAIGGVVNMETLDPTVTPQITVSQSWGTWDKLATSIQATGTQPGGKLGYAFALGTQGLDGPIRNDSMYQASAAYDQYATDPAVRALGVYVDDTGFINRSALAKLRYNFSETSHLTADVLGSAEWDNKTGNGDNDYLPYQVELASGEANLQSAIQSGTDSCNQGNPNEFTVQTGNGGGTPGFGPNGQPDGGSKCQTPQSFALANYGYQGAGPAWQAYHSDDYDLKYDKSAGNNSFVIDTFGNIYHHNYDRTFALPYGSPFWYVNNDTNSGMSVSDDIDATANDLGFGFFYENTASLYRNYTPTSTPAFTEAGPITHDTAFFLRDAYHAPASDLTTYLNTWFKHSTITNTSYVDPRIAFVLNKPSDVYRVAIGRTSTQPTPDMLDQPFSPASVGAFSGGGVSCSALNSVGNTPSTALKPEQATDEEASYGHRFSSDSTAQLTLYSTNLFGQIYGTTAPLSSVSLPGFDPTPYANVIQTQCPGLSLQQAIALLGVSGNVNIGHTVARGIELTGRQRWSTRFFTDYSYDTQSSFLQSNDPSLVNPADGGSLFFIPGSQLPNVPLHKYSYSFDYTFGGSLEARIDTYHYSVNNSNNLPAYSYSNLDISKPLGNSTVSVDFDNLFNQDADFRNMVGLGVPLPLNHFAQASDYQQYFGAGATELFHLPYRTFEIHYTTKIR